jgi:hypothetical protein
MLTLLFGPLGSLGFGPFASLPSSAYDLIIKLLLWIVTNGLDFLSPPLCILLALLGLVGLHVLIALTAPPSRAYRTPSSFFYGLLKKASVSYFPQSAPCSLSLAHLTYLCLSQ